jgi:hypothetical protein
MALNTSINTSTYTKSEEDSFKRILETPLGSRVMRPNFGSNLFELIDKPMDGEFKMFFSRYLLDAFFNENDEPWDERLIPLSVKITDIKNDELSCVVIFADSSISMSMKGFSND